MILFALSLINVQSLHGQCPDIEDQEILSWGFGALSMFYANPFLEDYRLDLGISRTQIDTDDIELIEDDTVCNMLYSHIQNSGNFHNSVKEQNKIFFRHEPSNRIFIIFYTTPAQPGWSTGVYVLDNELSIIGKFGV